MTVYVIGAGIAGLSAAYTLTKAGIPVAVYEASAHAGGRCHSFFDKKLTAQERAVREIAIICVK